MTPDNEAARVAAIADQWREYEGDFNAMSDEEIEAECQQCLHQIDEAESWLEAVSAWEAAGKPRALQREQTP